MSVPIPDGISTFPTVVDNDEQPSTSSGVKRSLDNDEECCHTPPHPPPLWTSSKASFALGAPVKRRKSDNTTTESSTQKETEDDTSPSLGPTLEATPPENTGDGDEVNIFACIKGDIPEQYRNLILQPFWHINQDIPLLAAFFYLNNVEKRHN